MSQFTNAAQRMVLNDGQANPALLRNNAQYSSQPYLSRQQVVNQQQEALYS